jgi:hypothetical protein
MQCWHICSQPNTCNESGASREQATAYHLEIMGSWQILTSVSYFLRGTIWKDGECQTEGSEAELFSSIFI